jgi:hypothetical protein
LDQRYNTTSSKNNKDKHKQSQPKQTNNSINSNTVAVKTLLDNDKQNSKIKPKPNNSNSNNTVTTVTSVAVAKKIAVRVRGCDGDGEDRSDDCDHHQKTKKKKRVEHRLCRKPQTRPHNHSHSHQQSTKETLELQHASSPAAVSAAKKGRRGRDKKKDEVRVARRNDKEEDDSSDDKEEEEEYYAQEDDDEEEMEEAEMESDFELDEDEETESENESEMSGEEEGNDAEAHCDVGMNKSLPSLSLPNKEKSRITGTFKGRVAQKSRILDAQWDKNWSAMKQRQAETGSWIVLRVGQKRASESKDNQLYNWMTDQRKSYSLGHLQKKRPDRYQLLKEAGFPLVISKEESNRRRGMAMEKNQVLKLNTKWHHMLAQLVEYRKQSGTWVVPRNQNDKTLCNWIHDQRKLYRRGDLAEKTPDRYQAMLQAGFPFQKAHGNARSYGPVPDEDHKWKSRFEELKTYYSQYDTKIVSRRSHSDLHHWAHFQVRSFRKGHMESNRIEKLRSIGCPLDKWFFASNTAQYDIQRDLVGRGSSIESDAVGVARAATHNNTRPLEQLGSNSTTEQNFQKVVDQLVKWHSMYGTWHVKQTENPLLYRYVLKFTFDSNAYNSTRKNAMYVQRCKAWRTPARIARLRAVGFPIDDYLSSSEDENDNRFCVARKRSREADQEDDHDAAITTTTAPISKKKKKKATLSPFWCVKRVHVTCGGKSADSFELQEPLWFHSKDEASAVAATPPRSSRVSLCVDPPPLSCAVKAEADAEATQATVNTDATACNDSEHEKEISGSLGDGEGTGRTRPRARKLTRSQQGRRTRSHHRNCIDTDDSDKAVGGVLASVFKETHAHQGVEEEENAVVKSVGQSLLSAASVVSSDRAASINASASALAAYLDQNDAAHPALSIEDVVLKSSDAAAAVYSLNDDASNLASI